MRVLIAAILALCLAGTALAAPYGVYDMRKLAGEHDTPAGRKKFFDTGYMLRVLGDLYVHAGNYPPTFDNDTDRARAMADVKVLMRALPVLVDVPNPAQDMLLHTAVANSIGNNFDLQGAAGDAEKYFRKLLALNPEHPQGNMRYGAYLAGTNRGREALPYLLKAQALGVREASYTLGLTWLILGDKAKALENLERYQSLGSRSARIDQLIAAVRSGKGVRRNEVHD